MQELYFHWYAQTLQFTIALQSEWYTSGFLTRYSDQFESSLVKQIRRSIFLSSSLLPSLCVRNVSKAYLRPGFSIGTVLKLRAPLQFIIFVRKMSSSFVQYNVALYKIVRYSKDLGIAGCLPTAWESCDGLSMQSAKFCAGPVKYVLTSWSRIKMSLKLQTFSDLCAKLLYMIKNFFWGGRSGGWGGG